MESESTSFTVHSEVDRSDPLEPASDTSFKTKPIPPLALLDSVPLPGIV